MSNLNQSDFVMEITSIEPIYEYDRVGGGYFNVQFGQDTEPFKLSFAPFLDYRARNDKALFEYLKKNSDGKTISHAIFDLYDMGFPVDDWVREYIDMAKDSLDPRMFHALLQFYYFLKNFGASSGSLDDLV